MEVHQLHIRRLAAEYLVSAEHPEPQRVKDRLDRAIGSRLAGALAAAFSGWFPETDTSVWLIRKLDFDVAVNAAWERDQLARAMTTEMARSLGAMLHEGGDSNNVIRFPDRAAYLARFLSDAASGIAWDRWYYESFAGLRSLPLSAALRTAICDQTDVGERALLRLDDGERERLLSALGSADTREILDRLAANEVSCDQFDCFRAAWTAMRNNARQTDSGDDRRRALETYLVASNQQDDLGGAKLRAAALALSALSRRMSTESTEGRRRLLDALTGADASSLDAVAGVGDARRLEALRHCPPDWVREVAEWMAAPVARDDHRASMPGRRGTAFGGAFLLMPLIDAPPLAEATAAWPHSDEAAAISLVRFLVLVKCCGQPWAHQGFRDPLLRDLLLIPPFVSLASLKHWQSRLSADHLWSFSRTLLDWQLSKGMAGGAELVLASSAMNGQPIAVLIDARRGLWLAAERYSSELPGTLLDAVQGPMQRLATGDSVLWCEESLMASMASRFPEMHVAALGSRDAAELPDPDNRVSQIAARLPKVGDELTYLAAPEAFELEPALDLALSLAAQNAMRALAWRLPGFAGSNLPYLAENFLRMNASVEDEPGRRVVRLGRPPLDLVLNMTGMNRQTYQLSWLDRRPLALFQEV